MSDAPTPEELQAHIEHSAGVAVQHSGGLGITLDFSVESVEWVEALLSRMHETLPRPDEPPGPDVPTPDDVNMMISIYGAYVGEVIRRAGGGTWKLLRKAEGDGSEAGQTMLALVADDDGMCWPTAKVAKRVIEGPMDNVFDYVRVLLRDHWNKST